MSGNAPPPNMRNPPQGMPTRAPNQGMPPPPQGMPPPKQGMPPQGKGAPPPPSNKAPPEPQVVDAVEDDPRKDKFKNCCKKVLKFSFSQLGLCAMVIAYSVAGGFIFQHLERTNEQQECVKSKEKYDPLQNGTMYRLWDIASTFRADADQGYALVEFEKQLKKFRDDVLALGYDGTNCSAMGLPGEGNPEYKWSFPGALLFAVTVITTIGKYELVGRCTVEPRHSGQTSHGRGFYNRVSL